MMRNHPSTVRKARKHEQTRGIGSVFGAVCRWFGSAGPIECPRLGSSRRTDGDQVGAARGGGGGVERGGRTARDTIHSLGRDLGQMGKGRRVDE